MRADRRRPADRRPGGGVMIHRRIRPVTWHRVSVLTLLLLLALAGPLAGGTTLAGPPQQTPLVVRGANVGLSGGYTLEGQPGFHIQTQVLALAVNQTNAVYLTEPVQAPFAFSDVAPSWDDMTPTGGSTPPDPDAIRVELRTSPDGTNWTDWQPSDLEDITDPREPLTHTYASLVSVPQDVRT